MHVLQPTKQAISLGAYVCHELEGQHRIGIILCNCKYVDIVASQIYEGAGTQHSDWGGTRYVVGLL